MMNVDSYMRKATVLNIVDADTFDLFIDLGFDVWTKQRIRLAEIDAWEVRGEEKPRGLEAAEFVEDLMPEGSDVIIRSIQNKKGGFGRYLVAVTVEVNGEMVDLGGVLLEEGHAGLYPRKKG